jgi:hypothetical protein
LNTHYLSDYRSKFLSHYRASREYYEQAKLIKAIQSYGKNQTSKMTDSRPGPIEPTGIAKVLAGLAEIGMMGVKADDLPKLLPPDRMAPALEIMADVRAYFQGIQVFLIVCLSLAPAVYTYMVMIVRIITIYSGNETRSVFMFA